VMNLLLAINTEKKTTCDAGCTGRSTAPPISRTTPCQVVGRGTQQLCGCWGDALFAGWAAKSVRSWEPYRSRCEYPGVPWSPFGVPWSTLKERGQADYSGVPSEYPGVPWSTLKERGQADYSGVPSEYPGVPCKSVHRTGRRGPGGSSRRPRWYVAVPP
jgi:hypothetical protein